MSSSDPRKRLFLVDGHALAYRAHYALIGRPLRTSKGENTSVPWAVTLFTLKLFKEYHPEYLAFVFDAGGHNTFRHRLYSPYKMTREKMDDTGAAEFERSMERVREILEALRIPALEREGYEADDLIGSLAAKAAEQGLDAVIVSGDTDFYQLIDEHISVIEPGRSGRSFIEPRWIDAAAATERMGVPPARVIDYLALVGDPSDNIPGVRGIGPKSAQELLKRYGTVEAVIEHAGELESKRTRRALEEYGGDALVSKRLVAIRQDLPVGLDLESFATKGPDYNRTRDLFLELEFQSLLHEFTPRSTAPFVFALAGQGRIESVAREIGALKRVGVEGIMDDHGPGRRLVGISVALPSRKAYYLPLRHCTGPNLPDLGSGKMRPLREVLASEGVEKIGHDLKRLITAFRVEGIELGGILTDTMLAAYCLDPAKRGYDLETETIERFGFAISAEKEVRGKDRLFSEIEPGKVMQYAAERAGAALLLAERLLEELDRYGQMRVYKEIEMPLMPVLADMEHVGIKIDSDVLDSMAEDLDEKLSALKHEIYKLAGGPFNIDSIPQLREILFIRLGLPVKRRTKTGPSTDADVLAELASEGYPLPVRLLDYRELAKLKSTYVDSLRALISEETGRLHTSFNQAVAATGRLSSSEPNLQNIPIRSAHGLQLRKGFVPENGFLMLSADYSQIELRILAHLSGDAAFIAAFREGRDIHKETAARIFETEVSMVSPEMRSIAKTVNYATLYGQGARSLAYRLGIGEVEASNFIENYFERFPAIRAYLDTIVEQAERQGYVETIFGRRRYVPEIRSRNPGVKGFGRRVAMNMPVQGSAADIIKKAMVCVHRRLRSERHRSRMLLQIHDELLFEVCEDERHVVGELIRGEMEQVVELLVPLPVEMGMGKSWYEAKGH